MPTFGISSADCESNGRYGGHSDLLFKRMSFQTIQPFENMRSTAVHTLLSRTLRDLQSCVIDESRKSLGRRFKNAVETDLPSQVPRIHNPLKSDAQTAEKIAEYYIKKASTYSNEKLTKKDVEVSIDMPRVLQQTNFSKSLISEKSLLPSSASSNGSFTFLGTPTMPTAIPEPLKNHLTEYDGSRPSFGAGTTTSTPYSKKSTTVTAQIEESPEQKLDDKADAVVERRPNEVDTTTAPTSFLEDCYKLDIRLAKEYDEAKKRIERSKEQKALRVLTKRTVVEKVTVESKKTASAQELQAVSGFLCKLLTGQPVTGYGNKIIKLTDSDLIWYGAIVTIESYMGVVERDPSLAVVISQILIMISCTVASFESVLLGKLLGASHLLTLDEEKCASFAKHLGSIEDRRFALFPETSVIKLFFHLHFIGSKYDQVKRFTSEALWKVASFLIDEKPRVLATAMMLSEIVGNGGDYMRKMCPQRWSEFLNKIDNLLLPLEKEVNEDNLRRSIGEDTIVSGLRHAMSRQSIG
ncbi:hypothetical protein KIN20_002437 [Parelaphostrongylus tenuis]|uniref:Nucleoporin GLE1 n=1 Tax=Parelaphostrongylus tenuis TaxID=148309 RepID=A0AAD5QDJ4_PARTN|nr:hypothetical protein KIN20_002437 [Parelaphostrongylus tenuis]